MSFFFSLLRSYFLALILELGEIIFQILGGQKNKLGTKKNVKQEKSAGPAESGRRNGLQLRAPLTIAMVFCSLHAMKVQQYLVKSMTPWESPVTFRQILGLKSSAMAELTTRKV